MKVCVYGLGHLGCVTAACLADAGHDVTGIGREEQGDELVSEPGLRDMIVANRRKGNLRFTTDVEAVRFADVVWVTIDTPVDENDVADVEAVMRAVHSLLAELRDETLVVISSQLPVGSTRELIGICRGWGGKNRFAYIPENLRRGKGIETFLDQARIVLGMETVADADMVEELLRPLMPGADFLWMSIESAEMTKHAINGFLAASIVFINEIAEICERVGADAKDVERGLKSEPRIGPKAYLSPGGAFTGGTLGRDVAYLSGFGAGDLINSIAKSNRRHHEGA